MPKTDRSTRRRRLALVALVAALLVQAGSALAPAPVHGHAALLDADPAPNSVVPASPPELVLFFSEAVDPGSVSLRVLDAEQRLVEGLSVPRLDGTGRVLSAPLPDLGPDTYTVDYAVVSAVDGHPTQGLYAFLVDPTGLEPPPDLVPAGASTPPDPAAIAARWLTTVAALLLLGTVLAWLLHRRWIGSDAPPPAPWGTLAVLAGLALGGLAIHLTLLAAAAFGPPGQPGGHPLVHFDFAEPFGWTPFAVAMRLAMLGSLVAFLIAGARHFRSNPALPPDRSAGAGDGEVALALCGAGAAATLLGLSLTGHAAAFAGPIGATLDVFHLLGIATWLGALPAVGLLAWRSRQSGLGAAEAGRRALAFHSRLALVAAPVVVLTGLANSPIVVGDGRELVAAGYGNLLLAKAWLVSVALGLGAANFFLARLLGGRRLAVMVGLEVAVATVAVAVGVTMVSIEPAADRQSTTVDPRLGVAHLYGEDGESAIHGIVDLPEPGVQSYQVAVSDPATGAGRTDVQQVYLTFIPPPETDLPETTHLAEEGSQPWIWGLRGAHTPVVGEWELSVLVRRGRLVEDEVTFPLAVRQVLRPTSLPPPTTGGDILRVIAAPAAALPAGAAGWVLPVALLAVAAAMLGAERMRGHSASGRWGAARRLRLVLVVGAVAAGVSLVGRDVVVVANRAPAEWVAAANPLAVDPAAVGAGEELYRANCASCHGPDGAGDGPAADGLAPAPPDLGVIVPQRLDGELAWVIGAGMPGTQMPAFGATLLESERWELVSFLRSRWPSEAE